MQCWAMTTWIKCTWLPTAYICNRWGVLVFRGKRVPRYYNNDEVCIIITCSYIIVISVKKNFHKINLEEKNMVNDLGSSHIIWVAWIIHTETCNICIYIIFHSVVDRHDNRYSGFWYTLSKNNIHKEKNKYSKYAH